jgi:hypothetical protein
MPETNEWNLVRFDTGELILNVTDIFFVFISPFNLLVCYLITLSVGSLYSNEWLGAG